MKRRKSVTNQYRTNAKNGSNIRRKAKGKAK